MLESRARFYDRDDDDEMAVDEDYDVVDVPSAAPVRRERSHPNTKADRPAPVLEQYYSSSVPHLFSPTHGGIDTSPSFDIIQSTAAARLNDAEDIIFSVDARAEGKRNRSADHITFADALPSALATQSADGQDGPSEISCSRLVSPNDAAQVEGVDILNSAAAERPSPSAAGQPYEGVLIDQVYITSDPLSAAVTQSNGSQNDATNIPGSHIVAEAELTQVNSADISTDLPADISRSLTIEESENGRSTPAEQIDDGTTLATGAKAASGKSEKKKYLDQPVEVMTGPRSTRNVDKGAYTQEKVAITIKGFSDPLSSKASKKGASKKSDHSSSEKASGTGTGHSDDSGLRRAIDKESRAVKLRSLAELPSLASRNVLDRAWQVKRVVRQVHAIPRHTHVPAVPKIRSIPWRGLR